MKRTLALGLLFLWLAVPATGQEKASGDKKDRREFWGISWYEDVGKAKEAARKEGKHMIVGFSNSNIFGDSFEHTKEGYC